jgi:putative DNA methylase
MLPQCSKGTSIVKRIRRKLIEVALPLEAINEAAAKEKSIRHGHPSTLHLWWARRPLAAARAVIFAQMVDDPASWPELWPTEEAQEKERQRLFRLIEELVLWANTTNERVLEAARKEIRESWRRTCEDNKDHPRAGELFDPNKLPGFHDPFAGGGALPLEAQRLGLEAYASDLNPVAVLINKAMIEIPPKFAGRAPVNPETRKDKKLIQQNWRAQGLAEDVRYYGQWMRDEAEKRIGHLYPKVEVTAAMVKERPDLEPLAGRKLTVIAWIWARTVKSPNPAFTHVDVPLASTFMLSTKPGKEAYVEPVIERDGYRFTVQVGKPRDAERAKLGTTAGKRNAFTCLLSGAPITYDHIRSEGKARRMRARLMAIVAEGERGRVYLSPTPEQDAVARSAMPEWQPDMALPDNPRDFKTPNYGLTTYGDLFTPRQLVALTTFSDLVGEARERVRRDALAAGLADSPTPLRDGGTGAAAYADAVAIYLGMALSKLADAQSSLCRWKTTMDQSIATFGRQALPMVWDYSETNAFGGMAGDFGVTLGNMMRVLTSLGGCLYGTAEQLDAQRQDFSRDRVVSTDPPYYDNIGYADLSDYFYVWLRRTLRSVLPGTFATVAVPKAEELVATPYRHGSKDKAESFFLDGMTKAMHRLAAQAHPAFPVTIYYAFKQSESDGEDGTTNTGWDTFLAAVIKAGFAVSGTWPMRTELANKVSGIGQNMLASSIVLVCRPRAATDSTATRRDFVAALKSDLPLALTNLQRGNIAPVDLAQAAIGPGMAIYTRYSKVLDAEGKPLPVRDALALINQTLDEALAEQEGDFDADTRWALAWFDEVAFNDGDYGRAELLSKAKVTSVSGLVEAGFLASKGGKVRLLRPSELDAAWDPTTDARLTAWESVHHLVRSLESGGEDAAADLVRRLGSKAESARELAYRLYSLCERKKRAAEALSYNGLVQSWPEIARRAAEGQRPTQTQQEFV